MYLLYFGNLSSFQRFSSANCTKQPMGSIVEGVELSRTALECHNQSAKSGAEKWVWNLHDSPHLRHCLKIFHFPPHAKQMILAQRRRRMKRSNGWMVGWMDANLPGAELGPCALACAQCPQSTPGSSSTLSSTLCPRHLFYKSVIPILLAFSSWKMF